MPVQPMYFQPLSFDQANPFWTGLQKGEQAVGGVLENQQRSLANQLAKATLPYAAPSAQAQLLAAQLGNQANQARLPYIAPTAQAQLTETQLANQANQLKMPYVAPTAAADLARIQAQTGEANSQSGLTREQTRLLPLKTLIEAQNANQSASRFNQAYQLSKMVGAMSPAARDTWIAQNQAAWNDALTTIANKQNTNFLTPEIMQQYFPGSVQQQTTTQTAQQAFQQPPGTNVIPSYLMRQQPQQQQQIPVIPTQQGRFSYSTPEQNAQVAQANSMSANQKLTGGKMQDRYQAGVALEKFIDSQQADESFKTLADYSGLEGTIKAQYQKYSNPDAYLKYQSALDQFNKIIAGGLKVMEGYPSTDSSIRAVNDYFTKAQNTLYTDPKAAMDYFKRGRDLMKTEVDALQQVNQPIVQTNDYGRGTAAQNNPEMVTVQTPDGKQWHLPKGKLDEALKRGAKQING